MTTSLTLVKFKVSFMGRKEVICNEGQAKAIDDAYDNWKKTDNNKMIKIDGLKILVSRLVSIEPYFDAGLSEKSRSKEGNYYLELAERSRKKNPSPVKDMWLKRIRKNFERINKGLPWLYTEEEFKKIGL